MSLSKTIISNSSGMLRQKGKHQLHQQPTTTRNSFQMDASSNQQSIPTQASCSVSIDPTNGTSSVPESADDDKIRIKFSDWGFKIDRLFEVAYRFYKRNESKAFHPSFDERNKMVALIMQARYGNHDGGKAPDVGVLDLVGKRRQYEWSLLNGMSKSEAMSKFICALDDLCPIFKAHAEAVKISSGIAQDISVTKSSIDSDNIDNAPRKSEMDTQMRNIYSSLCKQTYDQFKSYAGKQYPDDPVKQKHMITSLQEQYYQQYISQMHPELKTSLPNSSQASNQSGNIPSCLHSPATSDKSSYNNEFVNNRSYDSSILPENQLNLVETVPYLDLPLPESRTIDSHSAQTANNEMTMQDKVKNSIYDSDTYCEENNVQADISSEELNSGLMLIDAPTSPVDDVVQVQEKEMTNDMQAIHIANGKPEEGESAEDNIIEPVRLFQNSDLPPIGAFESFPEPRPIKVLQHKPASIDLINPNLPPKNEISQKAVKSGDRTLGDRPEQHNSKADMITDRAQNSVESISQQSQCLQNSTTDDKNRSNQYDSANRDHQQDCAHQYSEDELTNPMSEESLKNFCSQNDGNEESHRGYVLERSKEQGPELWDSMSSNGDHSPIQDIISCGVAEPATIWTKREVAEFKESLGDDKQSGIYEVKEGTLVIIQVPTFPGGKYIYWEFATDDYDIGFGLEFVYEKHVSQPLALTIYEDLDEDDLDDMIEEDTCRPEFVSSTSNDLKSDGTANNLTPEQVEIRHKILTEKKNRFANTIGIVPTYRRDSHQEVLVGRHKYPGQGYYLLRFDNTYSVLRSKTLYFRICYFV